jgi:hypothetical protein
LFHNFFFRSWSRSRNFEAPICPLPRFHTYTREAQHTGRCPFQITWMLSKLFEICGALRRSIYSQRKWTIVSHSTCRLCRIRKRWQWTPWPYHGTAWMLTYSLRPLSFRQCWTRWWRTRFAYVCSHLVGPAKHGSQLY